MGTAALFLNAAIDRTADLPVRRNVLRSGAFVGLEALDVSCAAAGEDARGPEEWFTIVTHSQSQPDDWCGPVQA